MKNLIIIFGNIASGKSTFCEALKIVVQGDYKHICLDEYRLKYANTPNMFPIERERAAEKDCLNALLNTQNVIWETTFITRFAKNAYAQIKQQGDVDQTLIRIKCPAHICLQRFYLRQYNGHNAVKPPFNKKDIHQVITDIDNKLTPILADNYLDSSKLDLLSMIKKLLDPFAI
jgi:predicted kinase